MVSSSGSLGRRTAAGGAQNKGAIKPLKTNVPYLPNQLVPPLDAKHIHEHTETGDLQQRDGPYKPFPAKSQADDPDTKSPASVDGAASGSRNSARNAEAKVVEAADTNTNGEREP